MSRPVLFPAAVNDVIERESFYKGPFFIYNVDYEFDDMRGKKRAGCANCRRFVKPFRSNSSFKPLAYPFIYGLNPRGFNLPRYNYGCYQTMLDLSAHYVLERKDYYMLMMTCRGLPKEILTVIYFYVADLVDKDQDDLALTVQLKSYMQEVIENVGESLQVLYLFGSRSSQTFGVLPQKRKRNRNSKRTSYLKKKLRVSRFVSLSKVSRSRFVSLR